MRRAAFVLLWTACVEPIGDACESRLQPDASAFDQSFAGCAPCGTHDVCPELTWFEPPRCEPSNGRWIPSVVTSGSWVAYELEVFIAGDDVVEKHGPVPLVRQAPGAWWYQGELYLWADRTMVAGEATALPCSEHAQDHAWVLRTPEACTVYSGVGDLELPSALQGCDRVVW